MKNENTKRDYREIVIPGDILEDNKLSDGAKILYGKIARLSFIHGYCWASNSFLDGTKSGRNASRFIAELKAEGYITIENENSKSRKIRIGAVNSKVKKPNLPNLEDNPVKTTNDTPPPTAQPDDIPAANPGATSPNLAGSAQPRQFWRGNLANSGEVTSPNLATELLNITNKRTTTTTKPPEKDEQLPTVEKIVAEVDSESKKLKDALAALGLVFNADFYLKAAVFMAENGLDLKYLSWLYDKCDRKETNSFNGLYYTLFRMDNIAEEYKLSLRPAAASPPPIDTCKVCGIIHAPDCKICPSCGLPENPTADQVDIFRRMYELDFIPDKRKEFLLREDAVFSECGTDFEKLNLNLAELRQEFGL